MAISDRSAYLSFPLKVSPQGLKNASKILRHQTLQDVRKASPSEIDPVLLRIPRKLTGCRGFF